MSSLPQETTQGQGQSIPLPCFQHQTLGLAQGHPHPALQGEGMGPAPTLPRFPSLPTP